MLLARVCRFALTATHYYVACAELGFPYRRQTSAGLCDLSLCCGLSASSWSHSLLDRTNCDLGRLCLLYARAGVADYHHDADRKAAVASKGTGFQPDRDIHFCPRC